MLMMLDDERGRKKKNMKILIWTIMSTTNSGHMATSAIYSLSATVHQYTAKSQSPCLREGICRYREYNNIVGF